jgi:hypothetical protein
MSRYLDSTLLCFSLICLYALLVFSPCVVNPGPLLQTDQPMWAATAHLWSTEVIPTQGWIWGTVTDRAGAGQVMGELYSLSIILPALLHGVLDIDTSVKVSMVISAITFMLGMFLAASLCLPRRYALLAAVMVLNPVFDNLVSGMWYNYFSLGLALSFWYLCDGFLHNPKAIWRPVVGACLLALSVYSHPVGLVLCLTIWASYLFLGITDPHVSPRRCGFVFSAMLLSGVLLAAPQIFALLGISNSSPAAVADENVRLQFTQPFEALRRLTFFRMWGAATPNRVRTVFMAGSVISVFLLAVYGFYCLAKNRCLQRTLPLTSVILVNVLIISKAFILLAPLGGMGLIVSLAEYYDRFQIVSQVYLSILAALGIWCLSDVRRNGQHRPFRRAGVVVGALTIAWIVLLTPLKVYVERSGQLGTLETSAIREDLKRFWNWVNDNVDPERERVYFEHAHGRLHWNGSSNPEAFKSHAFALTSVHTSIRQIGGWTGFTNRFALAHEVGGVFYVPLNEQTGKGVDIASDEEIHDEMRILNCKYIVALSPTLRSRLGRVGFMKQRLQFATFAVFENTRLRPAWAYEVETGNEVQFVRRSSQEFELVTEGRKGNLIDVSIAFHPRWRATCDESELQIANHKKLMQIRLPRDGGQHILFRFAIERRIPVVLVGCGLLLTCVLAVWGSVHGR